MLLSGPWPGLGPEEQVLQPMLKSEHPTFYPFLPRQAEEAPFPPPAVVPVSEAGGAAEGDPDAV
jgi:hypothetical protein